MTKNIQTPVIDQRDSVLRRFAKDEDGGIIVMTLLLLVTMLIMGGMAVDFMRFEAKRAELQSVADRAVLAAAELDQSLDAKDVVVDMFEKTGYGDNIIGEPSVNSMAASRSVSVQSRLNLDTFYLRLAGIDTLSVPAQSAAIEGAGNIEISLVLDISGSMGSSATDANGNSSDRITILQEAANNFIDQLLIEDYEDQISINLIAYSQQVNIGDAIFDQLTLDEDPSMFEFETDRLLPAANRVGDWYTNPSRCIDFDSDEFLTTTFDTSRAYHQVETFDHYSGSSTSTVRLPLCPATVSGGMQTHIIPLSQDADELKAAINSYEPTTFTAIHLGMKWGVSLLDPSMRTLLGNASGIDPAFAGERPSNYSANDDGVSTVKYVILMTDGQNVAGKRILPSRYDELDERIIWGTYPHAYWYNWNRYQNITPVIPRESENTVSYSGYSKADADRQLEEICTAAKGENIIVHAIAMGAGSSQMSSCASSVAGHYHETQGAELEAIFEQIAEQITELRLSL
ncbi:Flp pilus assembly protein TadG [Yoonia tamlensis]|uniref:Flp pilus assembly protein TadG n=1 Tax=Yoonia tamlensis TaxID=390270 RepID=A0A1I6GN44_9RHOB|nr:Tad domain-containing protein [Yoonia tamlensis]SFR43643.1 Flp pilus assembly protein TadG [Yoonia tamlensis]